MGSRHPKAISCLCYSSPIKALYNISAFVMHAASLRQACAHCGRFLAAASRRSLGRISVPMWPITLSGRLLIIALVSRYPTNKLISRRLIPKRGPKASFLCRKKQQRIFGITPCFHELSPTSGHITYVLLTRSPLSQGRSPATVRLACLKRAASVRSEPGSNSPLYSWPKASQSLSFFTAALLHKLCEETPHKRHVFPALFYYQKTTAEYFQAFRPLL